MENSVVAIVPARAGSKGIPDKNMKEIAGKPLVQWSIETGIACRSIDTVVVTTDDERIFNLAEDELGVHGIYRSKAISQDWSTDYQWCLDAIITLENLGMRPELIVQLRPTHPDRDPKVIEQAIYKMNLNPSADSLRSISVATQTPYKMWKKEKNSRYISPIMERGQGVELYNMPRQSLPRIYWQNGYVDITRYDTVMKLGNMSGDTIMGYEIHEETIDIDYEADWKKLEGTIQDDTTRADGNPWPS
jgi:N-acylneuraminate cytidylyltransferase